MAYQPLSEKETRLEDYQPCPFSVPKINLVFEISQYNIVVHSELFVKRTKYGKNQPFFLNGKGSQLVSIHLNGALVKYQLDFNGLTLKDPPDEFKLDVCTKVKPLKNPETRGLKFSKNILYTHCEPEGFRNITFFPDRPDVLSEFFVKIIASKQQHPVLLSNGNLLEAGDLSESRHFTIWHDPHPKPSYLFALVAGSFSVLEDQFTTRTGKRIDLRIYADGNHLDACVHAMNSLKRAMRWDEENYGRQYDLNCYMIVAVDNFHFIVGAVECKGLNIFNSKFLYANPNTATDFDFREVENMVAHEYFHNWSGNRVTLRDWFQLSLKEGFTLFREQQFSADMGSEAGQRIRDVNMVKLHQFREEDSSEGHPVQLDTYLSPQNLYSVTVYNKGAELIRMLYILLGASLFRESTDFYFDKFDGKSATLDEFVDCFEQVSGFDLISFRRWYCRVGVPKVSVERHYNSERLTYTLTLCQDPSNRWNGNAMNPCLHIPIQFALLDKNGQRLPLKLNPNQKSAKKEILLELTDNKQSFEFFDISSEPVPSILRGFSAPVIIDDPREAAEVHFTMAHDDDPYRIWNACQLASQLQIHRLIKSLQTDQPISIQQAYLEAFGSVLSRANDDPDFAALALNFPSEISIAKSMDVFAPATVHKARNFLVREIASKFYSQFIELYDQLTGSRGGSPEEMGKRNLRNLCLSYLITLDNSTVHWIALDQFGSSSKMTDITAALTALVNSNSPAKESALRTFYSDWSSESGIVEKWLRIQATAARSDTIYRVQALTNHQSFTLRMPSRISSLIGAFSKQNPYCFHAKNGAGYELLMVYALKADKFSPATSASLVTAFSGIRKHTEERQAAMLQCLQKIASTKGISEALNKKIEKILSLTKF